MAWSGRTTWPCAARSRARTSASSALLCEETYHTRILLSTALSYGVDVGSAYEPPASLRVLIGAIGATPTFLARPLIFASEILGVLVFSNLLEKSRKILSHDPELRDAVEERLSEVLVDELGHLSFNRACLGAAGIAQARAYWFPSSPLRWRAPSPSSRRSAR